MKLRYVPWYVAAGAAVTLAPGTPLWVLPLAACAVHMGYDVDPHAFKARSRLLLTTAQKAPATLRLLSQVKGRNNDEEGAIDKEEDRALAETALAVARDRVRARPNDTAAREKLTRLEDQARAIYPDLVEGATQPVATQEREPLFTVLDEQPHQLIIGHSRGGKTSVIHQMATDWAAAGERVVVCDPDMLPGMWPGCKAVGGGDDLAAMTQVLDITAAEVERRRQLRRQGVRSFRPIRLVVDEAQDVLPAIEGGLELMETIARRGAKLNIRMTVGVQDRQVKTLKLEGKSHILNNFTTVDVMKGRDGKRLAVIKDATGQKEQFAIPQLPDPESFAIERPAQTERPATRPAPQPQTATNEQADPLLASLLEQAPPKQERASVRVEREGAVVNVYASAQTAASEPERQRFGRTRTTTATNMRRRAAKAASLKKAETLEETYARLAHLKFEDAFAQGGGGRNKAHAAWKKAGGGR